MRRTPRYLRVLRWLPLWGLLAATGLGLLLAGPLHAPTLTVPARQAVWTPQAGWARSTTASRTSRVPRTVAPSSRASRDGMVSRAFARMGQTLSDLALHAPEQAEQLLDRLAADVREAPVIGAWWTAVSTLETQWQAIVEHALSVAVAQVAALQEADGEAGRDVVAASAEAAVDADPPLSPVLPLSRAPARISAQAVAFLERGEGELRAVALLEVLDAARVPLAGADVRVVWRGAAEVEDECATDRLGRCLLESPWVDVGDIAPAFELAVEEVLTPAGERVVPQAGHRVPAGVPLLGSQLLYFPGAFPPPSSLLAGRELIAAYQYRDWQQPSVVVFEDPDRSLPESPVEGELALGTLPTVRQPLLRVNDARPARLDRARFYLPGAALVARDWRVGGDFAVGPWRAMTRVAALIR